MTNPLRIQHMRSVGYGRASNCCSTDFSHTTLLPCGATCVAWRLPNVIGLLMCFYSFEGSFPSQAYLLKTFAIVGTSDGWQLEEYRPLRQLTGRNGQDLGGVCWAVTTGVQTCSCQGALSQTDKPLPKETCMIAGQLKSRLVCPLARGRTHI